MTHTLFKTLAAVLLTLCILSGAGAAAGSISIDTNGLTGIVGETIPVPVIVTVPDGKTLYGIELQCEIGETADYKIVFNETSMLTYGFYYNQTTGKAAQINMGVTGEKTLFYLNVTPKKVTDVPLSLTVSKVRDGTIDTGITSGDYTIDGTAVLTVTSSSGGDSGSGSGTGGSPGGVSPEPSVTPTATPTATATPTETVPTTVPTPSETVPTLTPSPTIDKPDTGVSYIPWIIAAVVVLGFLILIIVIVRRRRGE